MIRTAKELGEFLACSLEGDGTAVVSGVAAPGSAKATDLIYVDSARRLEQAAVSAARSVLIGPELTLGGKTLLRSDNPKLAFARAAAWLLPPTPVATGIHPTALVAATAKLADDVAVGPYAVIEDDVEIGKGTQVGAFCYIGRKAQLGDGCSLYPRVTLYAGARIANRVILHSGAVIGSDGFGYVTDGDKRFKFPQVGDVKIGDDVEIGANTTIDRGSLECTEIRQGTKLDNLVHVAHNVRIGENTVIAAQTGISGSVIIGKNVVIGGQVGVADHCKIQEGAIVGAQAGIPSGKIIRSGHTVWGTPARPLEKFKVQYAWLARLPDLAERVRILEKHDLPDES